MYCMENSSTHYEKQIIKSFLFTWREETGVNKQQNNKQKTLNVDFSDHQVTNKNVF